MIIISGEKLPATDAVTKLIKRIQKKILRFREQYDSNPQLIVLPKWIVKSIMGHGEHVKIKEEKVTKVFGIKCVVTKRSPKNYMVEIF